MARSAPARLNELAQRYAVPLPRWQFGHWLADTVDELAIALWIGLIVAALLR